MKNTYFRAAIYFGPYLALSCLGFHTFLNVGKSWLSYSSETGATLKCKRRIKKKKRKNIRLWDLSNNFIIDKNLNAAARGTTITPTTKLADLEPYTRASE